MGHGRRSLRRTGTVRACAGELSGETAAKYQHPSCNGHWNSRLHRFALCRCARGTGVTPDHGDILVTGASGGVGSVAVALLAARGFSVAASTGKPDAADYLRDLGATSIIDRNTLSEAGKPLQAEQWAGVVDAVGGNTLANACAQTRYGGVVTACGLAESAALPATVMPFILRGVVLRGVDSVMAPSGPRLAAWARLARDMDLERLETMITEIGLSDVNGVAPDVLAGKVTGRLLVDVNR